MLLIDGWKWSPKTPSDAPSSRMKLSDFGPSWLATAVSFGSHGRDWPLSGVTAVSLAGVTAVTGYCLESRPWVCQSHGRDSASALLCCFALRRTLHPSTRLLWHFLLSIFQLQKWVSHAILFIL